MSVVEPDYFKALFTKVWLLTIEFKSQSSKCKLNYKHESHYISRTFFILLCGFMFVVKALDNRKFCIDLNYKSKGNLNVQFIFTNRHILRGKFSFDGKKLSHYRSQYSTVLGFLSERKLKVKDLCFFRDK